MSRFTTITSTIDDVIKEFKGFENNPLVNQSALKDILKYFTTAQALVVEGVIKAAKELDNIEITEGQIK